MNKFGLRLYITGRTSNAERAIANLKAICEQEYPDQYEFEVIDVLERPQLAEADKILATPTLIKLLPPPVRRLIGDFSDQKRVLFALDLQSCQQTKDPVD